MESAGGIKSGRRRRRAAPSRQAPQLDAFTLADTAAARPAFSFVDDDAIARLKARAFDLLDGHGVVVVHPKGAEALERAGATPGRDADRLRLPRQLVEEALAATPRDVTLYGKDPAKPAPIEISPSTT
jgi:trimethylamine:corrinoid methyltransferase-like protein